MCEYVSESIWDKQWYWSGLPYSHINENLNTIFLFDVFKGLAVSA